MKKRIVLKTRAFKVVEKIDHDRTWHYVDRKDGVAILAVNEKQKIILVKQKRPVVGLSLLEIPAGGVDGKSTLLQNARRELEEETGFSAKRIKKIAEIYPSPGYYTEKTHIFLADSLALKHKKLTVQENRNQLTLVTKSLASALLNIKAREIVDAKTVAAILLYAQMQKDHRWKR